MDPSSPVIPPGKRLKKLRLSVGLSTREVERRSRQVVASRQNPEFLVSHSRLRSIEEGRNLHTPSIYKFYTLSALYNRSGVELASYFGVPFGDVTRDRALFDWPSTHLIDPVQDIAAAPALDAPILVPSDTPLFDSESTILLTKLAQIWGDIPAELIRKLDTRRSLYAYIGKRDFRFIRRYCRARSCRSIRHKPRFEGARREENLTGRSTFSSSAEVTHADGAS